MTTPYIGSKISLISRLDIRYEGTLHSVDPVESTISLSQVRSFGTEDRPAPVSVPARQDIYEFIIFKASDIKDLIVCETQKPTAAPTVDDITYDPAIISVSKPPPVVAQQQQNAASDERGSAQEYSQASSPQLQQQSAVADQQLAGQQQQLKSAANHHHQYAANNGGFGQHVQRAYYNRAMMPQQAQQPQQQHQYSYHAQQQHQPVYEGGQHRRSGPPPQNRQGHYQYQQHRPPHHYNHHQQQQQQPAPRFDGDYDFEKANEQFRDTVGENVEQIANQLLNAKLQERTGDDARASQEREKAALAKPKGREKVADTSNDFYDRNLSFFDDISCEALERESGGNNRVDWKKERMTNQETFGTSAVRMQHNYRRGRGGGHPNQNRQNYYHPRYNNNGDNQRYGYGAGGGRQQQQHH